MNTTGKNITVMKVAVHRKAHFNAAHRLFNPKWTDEKNFEVFGMCSNPHYHGHNYELEVKVVGEVNPKTGYCYDLSKLANIIKQEVEDRYDHRNLNIECKEFENLIPTAEHICYMIYQHLRKVIEPQYDIEIKLWETPRNFVSYPVD
jgi:6-pyruvoyltetrahydropterin/6-carboxytetrahydropterin synthase